MPFASSSVQLCEAVTLQLNQGTVAAGDVERNSDVLKRLFSRSSLYYKSANKEPLTCHCSRSSCYAVPQQHPVLALRPLVVGNTSEENDSINIYNREIWYDIDTYRD